MRKEGFNKGVAQNMVQVETVLCNQKRKAESIDDAPTRLGAIADTEAWMVFCRVPVVVMTSLHSNPPEYKIYTMDWVAWRRE